MNSRGSLQCLSLLFLLVVFAAIPSCAQGKDLWITKTVDKSAVSWGGIVNYTINYGNINTNIPANNVYYSGYSAQSGLSSCISRAGFNRRQ